MTHFVLRDDCLGPIHFEGCQCLDSDIATGKCQLRRTFRLDKECKARPYCRRPRGLYKARIAGQEISPISNRPQWRDLLTSCKSKFWIASLMSKVVTFTF
jgi:hypothetical protein